MAYLGYFLKNSFSDVSTVWLNTYYYIRYYIKAKQGYFNRDFANPADKQNWDITFQDEFDGDTVDFANKWNKWHSENTLTESAPENSLDCIEVKDGKLHLYTKKNEKYPATSSRPFKTGLLNSQPYGDRFFSQQFGYFEICCKVPSGGLDYWVAFWLYGETWPPEIDVFEFMSAEDKGTDHSKGISMTTHWGSAGKKGMKKPAQLGRTLRKFFGASVNFDEHFHTYAIRWEWDYIEWYIDNIPVYRTRYNIPDNKMELIVNNGGTGSVEGKDLPKDFVVDYIRAYQAKLT